MADPKKDEHIEELLSKLQGIFGKLSHSEEEEAKQTIEVPHAAPKDSERRETPHTEEPKPAPAPEPIMDPELAAPPPPPPPAEPTPLQLYGEPAEAPPVEPALSPIMGDGSYESTVPTSDPERIIVPTALFFPNGRDAEAKSLAQKLETMTPKFTKVAFRLRVIVFLAYDPKSDWKAIIAAKSAAHEFQTAFVAVERPLDDTRKKAVAAELESRGVYFQEVPIPQIEKKAFYTDILLGLVFFFDSRRPPSSGESQGS